MAADKIVERYRARSLDDPPRPLFLESSQGVAWDDFQGRGERSGHPEDFPEYLKGCDIAFFEYLPRREHDPRVTASWTSSPRASSGWSNGLMDARSSGTASSARGQLG